MWSSQDLGAEAKEEVYRRRQEQIIARTHELREEHDALQLERDLLIQRMEEETVASGPPPLVLSSASLDDADLKLWGRIYEDKGIRSTMSELRLHVWRAPQTQEPPVPTDGKTICEAGARAAPMVQHFGQGQGFVSAVCIGLSVRGWTSRLLQGGIFSAGVVAICCLLPAAPCRCG